MELHPGETVLFEGHPSWRAALLFFAKGIGIGILIGAIVWLAVSPAAGVATAVGIAVVTIIVSLIVRSAIEYVITDQRLHIRRGIVSRKIQETRLGRVQNVTVEQGAFERILRIGKAEFDTASDDQNDFRFEGIADPDRVRAAVDNAHRLAEQHQAGPGPATTGV